MTSEKNPSTDPLPPNGSSFEQLPRQPAIRVPKIAEIVATSLREQIIRGDLHEGDTLPPEADLLAHFGVSRPTLREAFRILENESLISIRRGAHGGAEIHRPSPAVSARSIGMLLQTMGATVRDVHTARAIIEPAAARMAAENQTSDTVDRLRAALDEERKAMNDPDRFGHAALAFHEEVIRSAGNITLTVLWGMFSHIIDAHQSAVVADVKSTSGAHHLDNRQGYRSHKKLLDLMEGGDPNLVETFWRNHLEEAGTFIFARIGDESLLNVMG